MKIKTICSLITIIAALAATSGNAIAREQIQIVGSSTVFPFAISVAERFGELGNFAAPIIEATGTGGGVKLFCASSGESSPDIVNASRKMKNGEIDACVANGVTPVEIKVGFDGMILANAVAAPTFVITLDQLAAALAKNVTVAGEVVPNPYIKWSDIEPSLPNEKIEVLGPPPTSGTRDAFVELVMVAHCAAEVKAANADACKEIREDGAYVESGENDNLIVKQLELNPIAVGIFGYSFLEENSNTVKGAEVGGVLPTFEAIASGEYPLARSLYFYIKKEHVGVIPGITEYAAEFLSETAVGPDGYLSDRGLIPLPEDQIIASRATLAALTPVTKE